jgi:hypothetical protein
VGFDGLALVKARQDTAGGVVDHVHQYHRLTTTLGPVVDGGIHLYQLTKALATRPALAMRVALPLCLPQSLCQQPLPEGFRRYLQALLGQFFTGESRTEVGVVPSLDSKDFLSVGRVDAVIGGLSAEAVDDGLIALDCRAALNAADPAYAQAQQASHLALSQVAGENLVHDFENITFGLAHGDPVAAGSADRHGSSLAGPKRTFLSGEDRAFLFWFDSTEELSPRELAGYYFFLIFCFLIESKGFRL